jgi:hypothetical protein
MRNGFGFCCNQIKNEGKVGRKSGSIEIEEETLQKHSDVLKLLKKKLFIC